MIKEKELAELTSWIYDKSMNINLEMIEEALQNNITEKGYNITLVRDTITGGSLFNPREYGCIKICCPEHTMDYFYYAVAAFSNANDDSIHIYLGGKSSQIRKDDMLGIKVFDGTISRSIGMGAVKGGSMGVGMAVGGTTVGLAKAGIRGIGKGIAALTRDKEALEVENNWYAEAQDLILYTFAPEE